MDVYKSVYYCISLYTPYIQSGRAWPRWWRSRSSWPRPRSTRSLPPHETCRHANTHDQTSVKWVVLTTVMTHQLIRARERHQRHKKQPPTSHEQQFVCKAFSTLDAARFGQRPRTAMKMKRMQKVKRKDALCGALELLWPNRLQTSQNTRWSTQRR